jgi:hypothetical protein
MRMWQVVTSQSLIKARGALYGCSTNNLSFIEQNIFLNEHSLIWHVDFLPRVPASKLKKKKKYFCAFGRFHHTLVVETLSWSDQVASVGVWTVGTYRQCSTQGSSPCENYTWCKKANYSVYEWSSFTQPCKQKKKRHVTLQRIIGQGR